MPAARPICRSTAALLLAAAASAHAGEIPAGSTLSVRLESRISSGKSRAGDEVDAVLIAPLRSPDQPELPAGSWLRGHVVAARGGFARRAVLRLRFDELTTPDGRHVALAARVSEVDNAREAVGPDGTILGLPPFSRPPSAAHAAWLVAAHAHPLLLALFEVGRLAKRKAQRGAIDFGPGVELELVLDRPAAVPDEAPGAFLPVKTGAPQQDLIRVVEALPLRTFSPLGRPADLTNVLLLGSRAEVEAAFEAAGWTQAKQLRPGTAVKSLAALLGKRAYDPAPVSRLELEGRPPDLVFEKQCNTLAKRHHVRLWGGFDGPDGTPGWLGAATHDVAIQFSRREWTFTHRIEPRIDRERSKLVDDLLFTGRVVTSELVERPLAPRALTTAAGARIETDGRMAVLALRAPAAAERVAAVPR